MRNLQLLAKLLTILLLCNFPNHIFAQTTDLFRLEYLYIPNSNSGNSIQGFRGAVQIPLKIKERNYIVVGADYEYIDLTLEDVPFSTADLSSVQRFEGTLGYLYQPSDEWIYAGKAGARIASDFDSKIQPDDVLFVVGAYIIRDRTGERATTKPNRLILGLLYTTTPGRNFPLPFINYYREFRPNWTYTLGVPKTNIRYKIDEVNHFQAFATLDNFFANIQANKSIDGKLAENISMTTILLGLGYEHYFTDHLLYFGYVGYTLSNDYRLRNNDRDDIYIIEDKNSLYFRTGLKFKF